MKDALILEHKTYISARRAAEITGYTSDYVGQLCRANKIESKIVGRAWFVVEQSILQHKLVNDEVKTNKKTAKKRQAIKAQNILSNSTENPTPGIRFISRDEIQVAPTNPVSIAAPVVSSKCQPEESPLLPLLKKTILVAEARKSGREIPVRFVPRHFSMRNAKGAPLVHFSAFTLSPALVGRSSDKSSSLVFENNFVGNFAAIALLFIVIAAGGFFMMQSSLSSLTRNSSNFQSASVASVTKDIIDSVARGFNGVTHKLAVFLGLDSDGASTHGTLAVNTPDNSNQEDLGFNGIAVVPSTNSPEKDELIKERIRASFSDEVQVHPDQSGTAGVITPVFRKATKDNFVYVLVPVQETKQ